jgi:hypothetical protein
MKIDWKIFFNNRTEIIYWYVYGLLSCIFYGWWGLLLAIPVSFLGRLGGMDGHSVRVFGCPLLVLLPKIITMIHGLKWQIILTYALSAAIASMSYNVPDFNQKKAGWLGTFYYNKLKGKQPIVDIAVRGTIFIMLMLALTPLLIK